MPCYFPLQAVFSLRCDGLKDITFSNSNARAFAGGRKPLGDSNLSLPCGRCMGCRLEKSRQWAVRCVHESKCYDDNCFVTLTFSPENVPKDGSVRRVHVQNFMKDLRNAFVPPCPDGFDSDEWFREFGIRVFYCAEYGDNFGRPHYHLCLFNFDFPDRVRFTKVNDFWYYTSDILKKLWPFGHSTVCDFSFETAAYVARYCTKKVNGEKAKAHYGDRVPEFAGMSLRPGIGKPWFDKYGRTDLFPNDNVISRGVISKVPRYYDILREREDPVGFAKAKEARRKFAEENSEHSTADRLADRLKCLEARTRLLIRKLENV